MRKWQLPTKKMAQAQNEDAAVSAAKNAAKHASELAVKAEKKAVDKGTLAEQLKAKADSKASLSRAAALTAAELSAKAVAEAGLSAGGQGKAHTLAQEKTDAVATLKKAEADKEFATGLKAKHLRGQAAQKVEKAVDCVVDKAKKEYHFCDCPTCHCTSCKRGCRDHLKINVCQG